MCSWNILISGSIYLTNSPDREIKPELVLGIKAAIPNGKVSPEQKVPVLFYTLFINDPSSNQNIGKNNNCVDIVSELNFIYWLIILHCSSAEDTVTVLVKILDVNDNSPEFLTDMDPLEVSVPSNTPIDSMIAKIEVLY